MRAVLHSVGRIAVHAALAATLAGAPTVVMADGPSDWRLEFPDTDFTIASIDFDEIITDGPRRDQIPPIDDPKFVPAATAKGIGAREPVISVGINGDFRAYPLRILLWHEIVNDVVGGMPILVTYCPLCNSGVVFDRRIGGEVVEFGNTGRIRHFDMVMYDKATESWWQQFLGEAIVGELTGTRMSVIPARLESVEKFQERAPDGKLLVPSDHRARPYGQTPYVNMDQAELPRERFGGNLPDDIEPIARLIVVGDEAWTLDLLEEKGRLESGDIVLTWQPGQNSIHDAGVISQGRDVGNVVVQRRTADGLEDVAYDVAFAFAFAAFIPDGTIHRE
ncbi:MAG: DUF3179 domain-containing protein [Alphaproteobacteria bacterium]